MASLSRDRSKMEEMLMEEKLDIARGDGVHELRQQ